MAIVMPVHDQAGARAEGEGVGVQVYTFHLRPYAQITFCNVSTRPSLWPKCYATSCDEPVSSTDQVQLCERNRAAWDVDLRCGPSGIQPHAMIL
ncbi:hypothetical protein FKM82_018732 [Ascaphus truei]